MAFARDRYAVLYPEVAEVGGILVRHPVVAVVRTETLGKVVVELHFPSGLDSAPSLPLYGFAELLRLDGVSGIESLQFRVRADKESFSAQSERVFPVFGEKERSGGQFREKVDAVIFG